MMPDYENVLSSYPEYISKEQMRLICHISKKTARLLLQNGLIPCVISDRKTHTYKIAKSDIIEYLWQRDNAPEKYILPDGSYARTSVMSDAEHSTVIHVDFSLFEEYPDVLSVQQAAVLSGIMQKTVASWARKKHLQAFKKNNAYHIPKIALVKYLQSPRHRRNCIWKQNNLAKQGGKETGAVVVESVNNNNEDFFDVLEESEDRYEAKI